MKFIGRYRWLLLAVVGLVIGLGLHITHQRSAAHWAWALTAGLSLIPMINTILDDLRSGHYGVNIISVVAICFAIYLGTPLSAVVLIIALLGSELILESHRRRLQNTLHNIRAVLPAEATVVRARKTQSIAVADIKNGDKLLFNAGDIVTVDGTIVSGSATISNELLSGEVQPLALQVGAAVSSGMQVIEGEMTIKATASSAQSHFQQLLHGTELAAQSKAPFTRLAERYALPWSAAVFAFAGTMWVLSSDVHRFLDVIIVATPLPLIIGIPIAVSGGIVRATRFGIFIKNATSLERLADSRTIAFDKTGTLTAGHLAIHDILTYGKHTQKEVLETAAGLEQQTDHVIATAIMAAAAEQQVKPLKVKHISYLPGMGVRGQLQRTELLVGNLGLLNEHNIVLPKQFKASQVKQTAVYVAIDGALAGIILLDDAVRPESQVTLDRLKRLGIKKTLLITGDSAVSARKIAKALDIGQMYAETLPGEKLQIIESPDNHPLVFVGDGVHDAAALTAAHVGIALGTQTTATASDTADIVIPTHSIGRVAIATAIARRSLRIAKVSTALGVLLTIGLMALFATGKLSPIIGAAVQEVVILAVIANSYRTYRGTIA